MIRTKLPKIVALTGLAFLVTNLIWGAAGPVIKYTLDYIPPFTFLFLRFLIASLVLLPYTIIKLHEVKVPAKDFFNLFLLGIFSQTAIILVFVGLKYTTSLDSTIISIITGALTLYAGHYFYKEKVSKSLKIGVAITFIGTLVVILEPYFTAGQDTASVNERMLGNILVFLYNLTWVIYVIWSKMSMGEPSKLLKKTLSFIHIKPMSKKYSPALIVAITMYVGLITMVPLALMENTGYFGPVSFNLASLDIRGVLGLFYMALFSSIVAYFLNQWALEHGKVSDSVVISYLGPIFAFPVAFFLLGEMPNTSLLIGTVIVVAGVVIAEAGNHCDQD
jgi:drug/metabolite transporter (DMT)-like permease